MAVAVLFPQDAKNTDNCLEDHECISVDCPAIQNPTVWGYRTMTTWRRIDGTRMWRIIRYSILTIVASFGLLIVPCGKALADSPTPWLGLDGNGAFETGGLSAFVDHNIVYDRDGPHVWDEGVEFEAGELPSKGDSLERSIDAGTIPIVTIEYDYHFEHWWGSDSNFPHTTEGIDDYATGFVKTVKAIREAYPAKQILFEVMSEPWGNTTPEYNAAQYANVTATLLPALKEAGIPLEDVYVDAQQANQNSKEEWTENWVSAMYESKPALQSEIQGWSFQTSGPPKGEEGIDTVPTLRKFILSGENNTIIGVGYCAPDVESGEDCTSEHAENSTQATEWLKEALTTALTYHEEGWLRALLVYARHEGGWSMQQADGTLTAQGETLQKFADEHTPPSPPADITAPTISGVPEDDQALKATTGTWSGTAPISYSYQWESCNTSGSDCANIDSATEPEYDVKEDDVGRTLRVEITGSNAAGSTLATSAITTAAQAESAEELEAPSLSGTPNVHEVLYADPGRWSGSDQQLNYQWESCSPSGTECAPVEGATEPEYDLSEGDSGSTLRVRVGADSATVALTDVSLPTPTIGAAAALASTLPPNVSGQPRNGQALSTSSGNWSHSATLSYTYQWQRCDRFGVACDNIDGATKESYTLQSADVASTLRVVVGASEGSTTTYADSPATQPIAETEGPAVEQPPLVAGTTLEGDTLTVSTGKWSESATYAYQWERCGENGECSSIEGATGESYVLSTADVGSNIRALVSATVSGHSSATVSDATSTIEADPLHQFSAPSISGAVQVGGTLIAEQGIWSGTGLVAFEYQWKSCSPSGSECSSIEGGTEPDYTIDEGDRGSTLRVQITVKSPLGSKTVLSAQTPVVPSGELSAEAAREVAQENDPAALAASTTATIEGQSISPSLQDTGEELASLKTLTTSTTSKESAGELAVNTPVGELSLTPSESLPTASSNPTIVNGAAALFANTWPATDAIVRAEPLGAVEILQIRSSEAPTSFSWNARLGPDQQLDQLPDGSVAITDLPEGAELPGEAEEHSGAPLTEEGEPETSEEKTEAEQEEREADEVEAKGEEEDEVPLESLPASPTASTSPAESGSGQPQPQQTQSEYETTQSAMSYAETQTSGLAQMTIEAPTIVDADGKSVPASLHISGDTVTLTLKPETGTAYPLMAVLAVTAPTNATRAERDPVRYGLADDRPETFAKESGGKLVEENGKPIDELDPNLQKASAPLHVTTARLVIPYNVFLHSGASERWRLTNWVRGVKADGLQPYITLGPDTKCPRTSLECYVPSLPEYRAGIKDLIQNEPGIKLWGAWNEPDLGYYGLHPGEQRAAEYWQIAQYVADHNHCSGCKMIAGEFAFANRYEGHYISKYKATIIEQHKYHPCPYCSHSRPSIWGFHDYHDVVYDTHEFADKFAKFTEERAGKAQIWISEAGVELQSGIKTRLGKGDSAMQVESAEDFEHLHEISTRIGRIYYYGYRAPTEEEQADGEASKRLPFDSGLMEAEPGPHGKSKGEARPAYCILVFADHSCKPTVETLVRGDEGVESWEVARVTPNGLATTIHFETGHEGEPYNSFFMSHSEPVGHGLLPVLFGGDDTPCGLYHFRAVASNAAGTAYGKDEKWDEGCV